MVMMWVLTFRPITFVDLIGQNIWYGSPIYTTETYNTAADCERVAETRDPKSLATLQETFTQLQKAQAQGQKIGIYTCQYAAAPSK